MPCQADGEDGVTLAAQITGQVINLMGVGGEAVDEEDPLRALFVLQENGKGMPGNAEAPGQRHLIGKIIRPAGRSKRGQGNK